MSQSRSLGERSYGQFADRFAAIAPTKPHNAYLERPATMALLGDVSGLRVLDAGCGPGIYAADLIERGAEVVGLDVTPRMLELARERLGDAVELRLADLAEPLPLPDASFDRVLSALALDHVEDWRVPFGEFARVLRPAGVLVASVLHPLGTWLWTQRRGLSRRYFDVEQFEIEWTGFGEPRPLVREHRRPLAAMLAPLLGAGFALEAVVEPEPTADFAAVDPEGFAAAAREPFCLCLRAALRS